MRSPLQTAADRRSRAARRELADTLQRLIDDAGITRHELATTAGVARSYVCRILDGVADPSLETYQRLAAALGADLSTRLYPNSGPAIRDRHQAPMLELVLRDRHPRWGPFTEVLVRRPSRGSIDLVLHEARERLLVASELESQLRRLEQQVRWAMAKEEALPSWDGWPQLGEPPPDTSRLLVVRRTRATRQVATEFARQLRVAYPAHPDDALASLTGSEPWPGASIVWAVVEGDRSRLVGGR